MKKLPKPFCDDRLAWPRDACLHCGTCPTRNNASQEHIPSKCLLSKPYPEDLMTMRACKTCNARFAQDEEYLSVLLAAVLVGSTDPAMQKTDTAARMFSRQSRLRARIDDSRLEHRTLFGEHRTVFFPDQNRVRNVVLKNARGHALFDLERPMFQEPDDVAFVPLSTLDRQRRMAFETTDGAPAGWAEIGTRMFMRQCFATHSATTDMRGPWVIVQDDKYRYSAMDVGEGILVKSVIHEYLATEVHWYEP